jgi:hypothetical protein
VRRTDDDDDDDDVEEVRLGENVMHNALLQLMHGQMKCLLQRTGQEGAGHGCRAGGCKHSSLFSSWGASKVVPDGVYEVG